MDTLHDKNLIFPYAPRPLPGESVASWVIRLCGSHGYEFKAIERLLNLKPKHRDWDAGLSEQDTRNLLKAAGCEFKEFFDGYIDPKFLRDNHVVLRPRYKDGVPCYGFCPFCLKTDDVPYLRWRWRYYNFRQCTVHFIPLMTECPHCNACIATRSSLLKDQANIVFIPNLGFCKQCGQPLYEKSFSQPRVPKEQSIRFNVPEINPYDWDSMLRWLWVGKARRAPWRLKFDFVDGQEMKFSERSIGLTRYRKLNPLVRAKVAKAVAIYRAEKHRQRRDERLVNEAHATSRDG